MSTRAPRPGSIRILKPEGLLDTDARVQRHKGHTVKVVQPHGCPSNGTMGQCYVDCVTCGEAHGTRYFIGMVNVASLHKEGN